MLIELLYRRIGYVNIDYLRRFKKIVRGIPHYNVIKGGVYNGFYMEKYYRDPS